MSFFYLLVVILVVLIAIPNRFKVFYQVVNLMCGLLLLLNVVYFICVAMQFEYYNSGVYHYFLLLNEKFFFQNFEYFFIFDTLSLLLMFLTVILYLVCLLVIWNVTYYFKFLHILLYLVVLFVLLSFMTFDLLLFYIFFEIILIPMLLIIGIWGSRDRKLTAAFRFFLYTVIGSIFFLAVIVYLYVVFGTTDLYKLLFVLDLSPLLQKLFWFFTFFAFAVKIPLFPLHTWLPEAHAEAPTVGSIILAGILLKLGPYGLIRFSNLLFPYGLVYFKPLVLFFSLLSIYYTSITAIRQLDIKKVVAYSSIGHMALILIGICVNTLEGFVGAFTLLLAHGFVSGGLFLLIGCIYERYKTRFILYYNGLVQMNPKIGVFFFFFLLGNMAFPGTLNFVSEILILIGLMDFNIYLLILVGFSSVFILSYNLFLFSKLFFFKSSIKYSVYSNDLSAREVVANLILLVPVFSFGLFFNPLLAFFYKNSLYLNFLLDYAY